ncbi:hypothetical protein KI387_009779, partial [Taxus chinensis]
MDILLSILDFAASYNSYANLRIRMHQIPADRLPVNILRQEIEGTRIYLEVLQKATAQFNAEGEEELSKYISNENDSSAVKVPNYNEMKEEEGKLKEIAEEKLVSFCGHVLIETSSLQPGAGEAVDADVHRVLVLRAPVIVKNLLRYCHCIAAGCRVMPLPLDLGKQLLDLAAIRISSSIVLIFERMVPDEMQQLEVHQQISFFSRATGTFGKNLAKIARDVDQPVATIWVLCPDM